MREITNNREDVPKSREIKKFIQSDFGAFSIYQAVFASIEKIYELASGEFIVNCTINSYPKRPIPVVYHLTYEAHNMLFYVNKFIDASFKPFNDDIGQLSFISKRTTDDRQNMLYGTNGNTLFHFTKIEPFKPATGREGNIARVTIKISDIQSLLFLIDEKGERVSPILDTKLVFLTDDIEKAYVELEEGQSIDDYAHDSIVDGETTLAAINEAVEGLEERVYKLEVKKETGVN